MIYALHGMLGLPSDWFPFFKNAKCPFLFEGPPAPYGVWAERLNGIVNPKEDPILVGYSLGGRLGLHAILHSPHLWKGALFVSTSLQAPPGKWQKDLEWQDKFEKLPWDMLMAEWNSQAVFAGTFAPERKESDFNRKHLAAAFQEWSAAKQSDLQKALEALQMPIYWVVGEKDPTAIRHIALSHPLSKVIICPDAGHRLQWDNPFFFQQIIEEFQHAYRSSLAAH